MSNLLIENLKGRENVVINCTTIDEANKIFALLEYNKTYNDFSNHKVNCNGKFITQFHILCNSPALLLSTYKPIQIYQASDVIKANKPETPKQTIAQFLNITEFPFRIFNEQGNIIYYEESNGYWFIQRYDKNNSIVYFDNSYGSWFEKKYDDNYHLIFHKKYDGYTETREYYPNGDIKTLTCTY